MTPVQAEARDAFREGYERSQSDHVDWAGVRLGVFVTAATVGIWLLIYAVPGGWSGPVSVPVIIFWGPAAWGVWKVFRSIKMR